MRKLDRAVYAIFLLVLLADVARAHASVPVSGDGGSILSAASQLQVSEAGDAILVFRRTDGASAQVAKFNCSSLKFSGWSETNDKRSQDGQKSSSRRSHRSASSYSDLAGVPGSMCTPDCSSPLVSSFLPGSPALGILEHTGSPAP